MTWCSDSSQLVSGKWVSSAYAGNGISGAQLRALTGTGSSGAGALYNDWDTGDDAKEFRYIILTYPSAGTLIPNEDGSFSFSAAPDGVYSWTYQLNVDYVDVGSPATVTMTVGSASSAFTGNITLGDFIASGVFSGGSGSTIISGATLDDFVASGSFSSVPVSVMDGNVTLGDFMASGTFYSVGSGGLDPTTPLGKVRLKIGDYSDLPILPDSVIYATLSEMGDNVNRAAAQCAQYILGMLTSKTHKRLSQLETWSGEQFTNYVQFLRMTILNPHLTTVAPVPYSGSGCEDHSIQQFVQDFRDGYLPGSVVIPPQRMGRVMEYAFT